MSPTGLLGAGVGSAVGSSVTFGASVPIGVGEGVATASSAFSVCGASVCESVLEVGAGDGMVGLSVVWAGAGEVSETVNKSASAAQSSPVRLMVDFAKPICLSSTLNAV